MQPIYDLIRQVGPAKTAVLIVGETGTGKELVARAIHKLSPRAAKLFVPLNCTAIPAELLESELFGHTRGAFTGAHAERVGKFQAADEGTLFLDEIGDMDYPLQAKLLRVLQEGVIEPVGANRRVPVDVRIVSSTNRDLEQSIRDGRFREDLYYRLNVFQIRLPPLRERKEDTFPRWRPRSSSSSRASCRNRRCGFHPWAPK
jgi:two-component system, NtrC family, response regulator AtoC